LKLKHDKPHAHSNFAFNCALRHYSTGFEQETYLGVKGEQGPNYRQLVMSHYLSHLSPDKLGIEGHMIPKGLFDNPHPVDYEQTDASGNNQCRMPSFREAWLKGGGSLMLYGTLSNIKEELGGALQVHLALTLD